VTSQADEEFRTWASAGREPLRRTAFLLSGDWHLADDLAQDALVRIYQAWPRLQRRGDLGGYARRVLVNLFLDHQRRPARRERSTDAVPDHASLGEGTAADRENLLDALRAVPPRQRAVLVLRYWEDLSVEQTAQLLGTSAGTVKSQTSRGLVSLRAALAERGMAHTLNLQEQP